MAKRKITISHQKYYLLSSKVKECEEVECSYKYEGETYKHFAIIKKQPNERKEYYLKKAEQELNTLADNGKLYKEIKKQHPFRWNKRKTALAVCVGVLAVGGVTTAAILMSLPKDPLLYRLAFNSDNPGYNSGDHTYANATVVGEGKQMGGTHKDSGTLTFNLSDHNSNYLSIPTSVLNNEVTTIAMWVKMPLSLTNFSNGAPLFGITWEDGYFYTSPYDTSSWNSYSIITRFNNGIEKNLTAVSPSVEVYHSISPLDGVIEPISNTWHLIGFTFDKNNLSVYQNGVKRLSYEGDYALNHKRLVDFKIGSATPSSAKDFNATIADVRVYRGTLNETDYKNLFHLNYRDFQTLNLSFDNQNLNDSIRGFNGEVKEEAKDKVTFHNKDNRRVVYLHGGNENTGDERSGFFLPKEVLYGHHDLTISTDIYFSPRVGEAWQHLRLFDFSSNDGKQFLAFYYTLYDTNRMRLEVIPNAEREFQTPWVTNPDFIMPIQKWINLSFVITRHEAKVLVNGEVIAHSDKINYNPSIFYQYNKCAFAIGRSVNYGDHSLECYLDNFQMFATALNDSEIQNVMGHYRNEDDNVAVNDIANNFNAKQCLRDGGGRLYLNSHVGDGVKATITPMDLNVIDEDGYIHYQNTSQTTTVKVTLSRGKASVTRLYQLSLSARSSVIIPVDNNDLSSAYYAKDSYQQKMQEANLRWMLRLDNNKLLHSYRLIADLDHPGESYGSWIREGCGGEGQFQAEYIGALARVTNYHDESGDSLIVAAREKLKYLLTEIRKCQEHYPIGKYGDSHQQGYLNAFTHLCFYGLEHGLCNHVGYTSHTGGQIRIEDGFNVPYNITIWVPFYMYHKQLMMCYDVMTYANMGNEEETTNIRSLAKTMFIEAADWLKREVFRLTPSERECALRVEWGGIAEAMYLAYHLTRNADYLKVAHFFEEDWLIRDLYENSNVFSGIHTNTTLPKLLSCCAAYEVLGDTFYLQAAENAWDLIVNHMSVANGAVSSLGEHFQKPDQVSQERFGEETCCSYNMLRLTDYLYKFTRDVKYAHYFEKVYYNHILASIDMVGSQFAAGDDAKYNIKYDNPQMAGKVYVTSTDFGHHKVYSSEEDSFWCCVATGTETFSKLTYGNFYISNTGDTFINMYNNIALQTDSNNYLLISGLKTGTTEKGSEYVEITTKDNNNVDLSLLHFIKPYWVKGEVKMSIDETPVSYTMNAGYMTTSGTLTSSNTLRITLPMQLNAVSQLGYAGQADKEYSYALYYGPYMLAVDLGRFPYDATLAKGDIYIHNGNGSDQSGQASYQERAGTAALSQTITFDEGYSYDTAMNKTLVEPSIADNHAYHSGIAFNMTNVGQHTLVFRPFMDICYERYSMYMYYHVPFTC